MLVSVTGTNLDCMPRSGGLRLFVNSEAMDISNSEPCQPDSKSTECLPFGDQRPTECQMQCDCATDPDACQMALLMGVLSTHSEAWQICEVVFLDLESGG